MHMLFRATLIVALLAGGTSALAQDAYDKTINAFRQAGGTEYFFNNAYGYAVFPTIGKGGIGIGSAHGGGRVYAGGRHVGDSTMTQLTIGAQLGGQAFSQIIFFEHEQAFRDFTSGQFEFSAQATAVAITAGASRNESSPGT